MPGGPSAVSSADAHFRQCMPLSWGKVGGEVQVADASGAGDDLAAGVVPLGAQPDVLRMALHFASTQVVRAAGVDWCCDLAFLADPSRS